MSVHKIDKIQPEKIQERLSVSAQIKKGELINEKNFSEYIDKPAGVEFLIYLEKMNLKLWTMLKDTGNKIDGMPRIQKKFLLFLFNNFHAAFNKNKKAAGGVQKSAEAKTAEKSGGKLAENTPDKKEKATAIDNKDKLIEIIKYNISNRRGVLQYALTNGYIKISDNLLLMLDFKGKKPSLEEVQALLKNAKTIRLKDKKTGKYIILNLNKPTVFIQKQLNSLYLEAQKSKTYPAKLAKEAAAKAVKTAAVILKENRKDAPASQDSEDNTAGNSKAVNKKPDSGLKNKKSAIENAQVKLIAASKKIAKPADKEPTASAVGKDSKKDDKTKKAGSNEASQTKAPSETTPSKSKGATKGVIRSAASAAGKLDAGAQAPAMPESKEKASGQGAFDFKKAPPSKTPPEDAAAHPAKTDKSPARVKSAPAIPAEPVRQKLTWSADKNNTPVFDAREREVLKAVPDKVIEEAVKENPVLRKAISSGRKLTPAKASYIFDDLVKRQIVEEYKQITKKMQEKSPGMRADITNDKGAINDLKTSIAHMDKIALIDTLTKIKELNKRIDQPQKAHEAVSALNNEVKRYKIMPDEFYKKDAYGQRTIAFEKIDSIMRNLKEYFTDVLNLHDFKFMSLINLDNILNMLTENFKNLADNAIRFNRPADLNKLLNNVTDFVKTFKDPEFAATMLDERLPEEAKFNIISERLNYKQDKPAAKNPAKISAAANTNKEDADRETENTDKIKSAITQLNHLLNRDEVTVAAAEGDKTLTKSVKIKIEIPTHSRLIDRLKKMTEDEVKDFINNLYKIFFAFRKDIAEKIQTGYFKQTARTLEKKAEKSADTKDLNEFYNFLNNVLDIEDCEPNQKYSVADYLDYEVNLE